MNKIVIIMALPCEAKPLIRQFGLKRISAGKFEIYESDGNLELLLLISGVGRINAAATLAYACAKFEIGQGDFIINIGTAAGLLNIGKEQHRSIGSDMEHSLYLINKITDQSTGRTYYPDLLYQCDLPEREIVTVAKPISGGLEEETLYDMESAAIYQTAVKFVAPDCVSFLKAISDEGESSAVTADQVTDLMQNCMSQIVNYIELIGSVTQCLSEKKDLFGNREAGLTLIYLTEALHCSRAMQLQLEQMLRYAVLADIDVKSVLSKMELPAKDRKAGKLLLEEFKKQILQA